MEFPEQLVYWITMISTVIDLVYENLIILIFSKKKKNALFSSLNETNISYPQVMNSNLNTSVILVI